MNKVHCNVYSCTTIIWGHEKWVIVAQETNTCEKTQVQWFRMPDITIRILLLFKVESLQCFHNLTSDSHNFQWNIFIHTINHSIAPVEVIKTLVEYTWAYGQLYLHILWLLCNCRWIHSCFTHAANQQQLVWSAKCSFVYYPICLCMEGVTPYSVDWHSLKGDATVHCQQLHRLNLIVNTL